MRRMYRSKKDTTGALDHRDVLLTMDDKSSLFDAFYIQNIKQAKREMSSVNLCTASNKVRKKKYVKRIIKDVDSPRRDDVRESVFLTPNKSLRVNKPFDPFDQLLNSSPIMSNKPLSGTPDVISNKIQKVKKTYGAKKQTKIRRINNSSSDTTDSEKENTRNDQTPDTSNIKMHRLLIEKGDKMSPDHLDESINDLVKNLTILKKANLDGTPNTFKYSKHRLTKNIHSPIINNSPLCSTPFKEKYRGGSIYKFSPISSTNFGVKMNPATSEANKIVFDANNSTVFEDKDNDSLLTKEEHNSTQLIFENDRPPMNSNRIFKPEESYRSSMAPDANKLNIEENLKSPIINNQSKLTTGENDSSPKAINDSELTMEKLENDEMPMTENYISSPILHTSAFRRNKKKLSSKSNASFSSLQENTYKNNNDFNENRLYSKNTNLKGTQLVPEKHAPFDEPAENIFEGDGDCRSRLFDSTNETEQAHIKDINMSIDVTEEVLPTNNYNITNIQDSTEKSEDEVISEISSLQTTELEPFLGFSNSNNKILVSNAQYEIIENETSIANSNTEDSVISCHDIIVEPTDLAQNCHELSSKDHCLIDLSDGQITSSGASSSNSSINSNECQSMYDTCNSSLSSQDSSSVILGKELVVKIERLNDSIFQKYYRNNTDIDNDSKENISTGSQDSQDYASFDDSYLNGTDSTNISINDSRTMEHMDLNAYEETLDSFAPNVEEDRCMSFVTTRRRNEVTNDSILLGFNDSNNSISSLDCDKTVLSNNRNSLPEKTEIDTTLGNVTSDIEQDNMVSEDNNSTLCYEIKELSNVESRKSIMHKESLNFNSEDSAINLALETKPTIVLQPGKKWERSLSIYRRMTMMADHFDQSILEDESLHTKGRKYRQSVISTMEMQDYKGSLHNESITSRRSTFVSKPCRSTIRIVKEHNNSRISLGTTSVFEDLKGFLNEDCDDTVIELSKLSIADSEHEVTVLENFHDTAGRISTARDYVLRRCNQTEPILFDECYPDTVLKNCHKIGEGVYGEVFLWRAGDGRARVMKIVPIAGTTKVNGEYQKDYHEIISEIVIAMELSALRAPIAEIERHLDEGKEEEALDLHSIENATDVFNEVLAVRCVYGSYPSRLLDLWELYDECKGSENDNPAILPVDQQYIVLELANAGQDLESYQFNSAEQAHALFLQVAFGLAVGEESYQFEHRDLHWGNVLIAPTDQKFATFVLRGRAHRVPRCGVSATIIDYSLSRLSLALAQSDCAALYNDLSTDDGLFDAVGDYQFEVYRLMRDKLGNDWKNFEPYTNILWLHYTVDKMITALRYKRTNTKIHKHYIAKLKGIKNRILDYGSAAQFVLTDNEF